jgi:hypothetical protein
MCQFFQPLESRLHLNAAVKSVNADAGKLDSAATKLVKQVDALVNVLNIHPGHHSGALGLWSQFKADATNARTQLTGAADTLDFSAIGIAGKTRSDVKALAFDHKHHTPTQTAEQAITDDEATLTALADDTTFADVLAQVDAKLEADLAALKAAGESSAGKAELKLQQDIAKVQHVEGLFSSIAQQLHDAAMAAAQNLK